MFFEDGCARIRQTHSNETDFGRLPLKFFGTVLTPFGSRESHFQMVAGKAKGFFSELKAGFDFHQVSGQALVTANLLLEILEKTFEIRAGYAGRSAR